MGQQSPGVWLLPRAQSPLTQHCPLLEPLLVDPMDKILGGYLQSHTAFLGTLEQSSGTVIWVECKVPFTLFMIQGLVPPLYVLGRTQTASLLCFFLVKGEESCLTFTELVYGARHSSRHLDT